MYLKTLSRMEVVGIQPYKWKGPSSSVHREFKCYYNRLQVDRQKIQCSRKVEIIEVTSSVLGLVLKSLLL